MKALPIAAAAAAMMLPVAAQAQEVGSGLYAGAQVGYHDFEGGFNSTFVGGYVGYNMPVGETLVAGVEGNYNFGIDGDADEDTEYGASAHLGFRTGTGMVFGRIGYQEIDFDLGGLPGDDTDGGVLYGIGGEFGFGTNTALRVTLDTISFDTTRVAAGVTFHF